MNPIRILSVILLLLCVTLCTASEIPRTHDFWLGGGVGYGLKAKLFDVPPSTSDIAPMATAYDLFPFSGYLRWHFHQSFALDFVANWEHTGSLDELEFPLKEGGITRTEFLPVLVWTTPAESTGTWWINLGGGLGAAIVAADLDWGASTFHGKATRGAGRFLFQVEHRDPGWGAWSFTAGYRLIHFKLVDGDQSLWYNGDGWVFQLQAAIGF